MKILDNIKKVRSANGFSQEYMAEKLGIATVNYGKIERGVTAMTIERLFKIAELLDVSVGDLLEIEPTKTDFDSNEKIKQLNQRIIDLEEQLNDKRRIIEFLSANDLLFDVARHIEINSEGYNAVEESRRIKRDFYDLDSLIKEMENRPFSRDDRESMIKYILSNFDALKGLKNE